MDMNQVLAAELNVKPWQVEAAVKLIDEGNTIPFISRYRKEATGSLNDEVLRNLYDRLMYLRSLNDRKAVVLASIEEQGTLTAELKKSIEEAATLGVVEDLYRPYRPKRRTRATIAIGKGLEPLAELVKIDPKSIGVGQYQHDMNQKKLGEARGGVVEDCVNTVGVDLNTASASLLEYISGVSKVIAKNIVAYREENGRFESRKELLKVAKLGPKAFEQCAGFMRITGGKNPLDGTSVHPESYEAVEKLFAKLNMKTEQISDGPTAFFIKDYKKMAEEIGVGEITLRDIIKELQKPGRDPRDEMPRPILRTDVLDMKDLKVGMILKGTVRNVIDFGAFVDIGVHQDGLVHISQMTKRFIKHPLEAVSVGDIVEVKVISLDLAKKRIGLSMLLDK